MLNKLLSLSLLFTTPLAQLSVMEVAEQYFSKGKYPEASEKFNEILKNPFASPRDNALSQCRLGIIDSIQNQNERARKMLELSLSNGALPKSQSDLCQYALLQIYVLDGANSQARDLVQKMENIQLAPVYVARVYAISAEIGHRLKDNKMEFLSLQKLNDVMEKNKLESVDVKILNNKKITKSELQKVLSIGENEFSSVREKNIAQQNILSENSHEIITATLLENYYLQRSEKLKLDKPRDLRVGIILPEGASFTRFNAQILRAASSFLNSSAANGVNFSIIVKTAPLDAAAAEKAALDLFSNEAVHALVGPLVSIHAIGVSTLSYLFKVPTFLLVPMGFFNEIHQPYIVRMGVLAKSQAEALVSHVTQELKLKNLGVFASGDAFGLEMARQFAAVAEQHGATVEKSKFFDPSAQVLNDEVADFIGPQDKSTRREEYNQLANELRRKALAEKRKFDPAEVKLPVKLSVDAVLIPDSLTKAKLISSTFAFHDAKSVRFLGEKQWIEASGRASLADEFLRGARVPNYVAGSFLTHLQSSLETAESPLTIERQVFDSLMMLRQAQYLSAGHQGEKLIAALHNPKFVVDGTTYIGAVDEFGEPAVKFDLMSYQNGRLTTDLSQWQTNNSIRP